MTSNTLAASYVEELDLAFGGDFPAPDPKLGLTLYGTYSGNPRQIPLAIIGDSKTVDQVKRLLAMCESGAAGDGDYPLWKQDFPGMSPRTGLRCSFLAKDEWCQTFSSEQMRQLENIPKRDERIRFAVGLFYNQIQRLQEREESPQVFICAPPRRMMDLCIPREGEGGRRGKKSDAERRVSSSAFHPLQKRIWEFAPDVDLIEKRLMEERTSDNFHHLLKSRAMQLHAPTQFIRPYTLDKLFGEEKGPLQDPATICWNLCVALFYKAGGRPWKLGSIPSGTCYVGISFYHEKFGGHMGTSLAQVFTPEGEGLVLKGERFRWESRREPHLSREAAERLMKRVLDTYVGQATVMPARIVVHKTSRFNDAERIGMNAALKDVPKHDYVTIYDNKGGIKLFRSGYHPPLRGTMVSLPDQSRLLYTRGYVPFMQVYPGPRVPRPIRVIFDETDTSRNELCREIMGLTRLNWNTADYCGQLPMTLQFARQVGNILREIPAGVNPESKYLYYM